MPHEFLSDFLSRLQDAGELVRISAPVDSGLEVAAITDRISKTPAGGPALFFEKPRNSSIPIVTNLLGSQRRLLLALGVDALSQVTEKMGRLLQSDGGTWLEAFGLAPSWSGLSKFAPRTIKTAVCQQVVKLGRDVNVWELPVPRCWPEEINPVLTCCQVLTRSPSNQTSFERFPVQVIGQQQLVPHWNRYHSGYQFWQQAIREQKQLPIALALGGDPLQTLATAAPLVRPQDALLFAGFLRGAAIDVIKARSVDLDVPAASEIVLEGYIDFAAPLADASSVASSSGHYLPGEPLPVIQVTAITHRANPVLPAIIPGAPPCEESLIGLAVRHLSLPLAQGLVPELVDLHQPVAGAGRNILFASLRKQHPGQARQALHAIWGSRLLGLYKLIVIVDDDIDVHNEQQVWFAVGSNVNPAQDVIADDGPIMMDDLTSLSRGMGRKMGIDATRKLPEENHGKPAARRLVVPPELANQIEQRWQEYGLGGY